MNYFLNLLICLDFRPIDEDDPADHFFNVSLDTAHTENQVPTFSAGRSKSYIVNLPENEGFICLIFIL